MSSSQNQPKSPGLGGTVIEYPKGSKRKSPPPAQEPEPAPGFKLNLLKHLPDCQFKRYVLDVAKMTQIPANTSLMVGLGIVSSVSARNAVVLYENGSKFQPLSMYVICEQDIGTGKSWLLGTYQDPVFDACEKLVFDWQRREEAAKASKENFDEPFPNFNYDTDATPEGLDETLDSTRGYFALASAEQALANSISGAGYKSDGKSNKDLWLKGFNGEYHSSQRSKRKGYRGKVAGSVVNIAQYGLVNTILGQSDGTGASERCWLLSEPSNLSERHYGREHQHYPDAGTQGYYNRVMTALAITASQCTPLKQLGGYRISASDWDKIYAMQNELKRHLGDGGKYSTATLKGMTVKADIQVMKLAANLAVMDECPIGLIPSKWIDAAIGMFRDYLEYIYYLLVSLDIIGTNAFEDWIVKYVGDKKTCTRRQMRGAIGSKHKRLGAWKEISPDTETGNVMSATIDGLIAKGIIGESEEFDSAGNSKGKLLRLVA